MRARKPVPPTNGKRVNGFLWCRACKRSWAYNGLPETDTWPTHRCGRDVRRFDAFLEDDPNHTALPVWKQEAKR